MQIRVTEPRDRIRLVVSQVSKSRPGHPAELFILKKLILLLVFAALVPAAIAAPANPPKKTVRLAVCQILVID